MMVTASLQNSLVQRKSHVWDRPLLTHLVTRSRHSQPNSTLSIFENLCNNHILSLSKQHAHIRYEYDYMLSDTKQKRDQLSTSLFSQHAADTLSPGSTAGFVLRGRCTTLTPCLDSSPLLVKLQMTMRSTMVFVQVMSRCAKAVDSAAPSGSNWSPMRYASFLVSIRLLMSRTILIVDNCGACISSLSSMRMAVCPRSNRTSGSSTSR